MEDIGQYILHLCGWVYLFLLVQALLSNSTVFFSWSGRQELFMRRKVTREIIPGWNLVLGQFQDIQNLCCDSSVSYMDVKKEPRRYKYLSDQTMLNGCLTEKNTSKSSKTCWKYQTLFSWWWAVMLSVGLNVQTN